MKFKYVVRVDSQIGFIMLKDDTNLKIDFRKGFEKLETRIKISNHMPLALYRFLGVWWMKSRDCANSAMFYNDINPFYNIYNWRRSGPFLNPKFHNKNRK